MLKTKLCLHMHSFLPLFCRQGGVATANALLKEVHAVFEAENLRPLMLYAICLVCTGPPLIQFAVRVAVQNSHLQYTTWS